MPKVCPKCQSVNAGFAVRCACGFDLSNIEVPGLLSDAPVPSTPTTPRLGWPGRFLVIGQFVALLGCGGSVLGVPLAILLSPTGANLGVLIPLALLGGVVGFCYWAAMFVVFTEVLRLREERGKAGRESVPIPPPQGEQKEKLGT
jgi:hypothetical protein